MESKIMKTGMVWFIGEGLFHSAEVYSAIVEGATITAILTGIHTCLFFGFAWR